MERVRGDGLHLCGQAWTGSQARLLGWETLMSLLSQGEAGEDAGGAADQPGGREDGGGAGSAAPLPAHDQARVAPALRQGGRHLRCAGLHARVQDFRPGAAGGAGGEWAGPGGRVMTRVGRSGVGSAGLEEVL